ncbi:MAG: hypothetical protein ACXWJT_14840, partial [Xanthobacteraceae bacterium]
ESLAESVELGRTGRDKRCGDVGIGHHPREGQRGCADAPVCRGLSEALHDNDPAGRLERMLAPFGIAKSLRQFGFDANKISDAASQIAALNLKDPRPVSQSDAENLLRAAL